MRRRDFIKVIASSAAAWPLVARAQQQTRQMRRVGILMPFPKGDADGQARVQAFRQELAKRGWSEEGNIQIDERWSTSNIDLVRADAVNLVALNPDVIVTVGDRTIPILTNLTRSIPIVVAVMSDPIGSGAVESFARPAGNVTGFSLIEPSVIGKLLEMLKKLAPGISCVGMAYNPDNPIAATYVRSFEAIATQFSVQPVSLPIHNLTDVERSIASLASQPNAGVLFPPDLTIVPMRTEVSALLVRHRIPGIFTYSIFAAAGGLASYGADILTMFRSSAAYVDRILRGEKPGELPIELPTVYRFVINLRTAKSLGLEFHPQFLATADEVIE